jgi:hypothetical protein
MSPTLSYRQTKIPLISILVIDNIPVLLQVHGHGDHSLLPEVAGEGISGARTNTAGVTPSNTISSEPRFVEFGHNGGGCTYIFDYVGGVA